MHFENDLFQKLPVNFLLKLQSIYGTLKTAERKAADYILDHPDSVAMASSRETASLAGCSEPTLIRFTRKLGYTGFADFKSQLQNVLLQQPTSAVEYQYITQNDTPFQVINKLIAITIQDLQNTLDVFDGEQYDKAVSVLLNAGKIAFFGTGDAYLVAQSAYNRCLRAGMDVFCSSDPDLMLTVANRMDSGDAVVIISHSGRNRYMYEIARQLKSENIPVILITNYPLSPVAKTSTSSWRNMPLWRPRKRLHLLPRGGNVRHGIPLDQCSFEETGKQQSPAGGDETSRTVQPHQSIAK